MLFVSPENCKNGLSFSPVSPNFGRVTRPMNPISLPSTAQNSTSAPLFRCPERHFLIPQTTIWDVPFCHLGYPISPFGISHFAIWDVPFHHLGYPISPFGVSHFTIWDVPFHRLGYPILPFGVSHFNIWCIPFHHLGCPISSFGMSHFAIWGIFSAHLCTMYSPIFGLSSSFFAAKYMRFLCQLGKLI